MAAAVCAAPPKKKLVPHPTMGGWRTVALVLALAWVAMAWRGAAREPALDTPAEPVEGARRASRAFGALYRSTFVRGGCSREAVRRLSEHRRRAVGAIHARRMTLANDMAAEGDMLARAEELDATLAALEEDARRRCGVGDAPGIHGAWHYPHRPAAEAYGRVVGAA